MQRRKSSTQIKYFLDGTHQHNYPPVVQLHSISTTINRFARRLVHGNSRTVEPDEVPLALGCDTFELPSPNDDHANLEERYGRYKEVVGWGSSSTVKVSYKPNSRTWQEGQSYAIKAFHRRAKESEKAYQKRASAEFCIANTLRHKNIIRTIDLLGDDRGHMCQVMEFCAAGDLYALLVSTSGLDEEEADCLYKQLLRGLVHCHNAGVAHRDLKPENILLTSSGCLKIADFGTAECVKYAWNREGHRSSGLCGSRSYIAPEVYAKRNFDAKAVDIWATGVIYVAMRTAKMMWRSARPEDPLFKGFLVSRQRATAFRPIELFEGVSLCSLMVTFWYLR